MKTPMMIKAGLLMAIGLACAPAAFAQDTQKMSAEQQAMMEAWQKAATVGTQHKLMEALVGDWTTAQTMWMDPKAPPMKETGKSSNSLVMGGRYLRQDFTGQWQGQPFHGQGYMGYDNVTGKHFSSWMDDASTGMFLAHGDYDAATRTYTFTGEMTDPTKGGAKIPVRSTLRVVDKDNHVFEMYETRDGKETRTMQIDYARAGN